MKYFFLFIILIGVSTPFFAQKNYQQLRESEKVLSEYLQELRNTTDEKELKKRNDKFSKKLKKTLEIEGAFDFPFKSLTTIGKIYSDDKLVRVITWNVQHENLLHDFYSFILKKDERRNRVFVTELHQKKQSFGAIMNETLDHDNWYGALYYDIVDVHKRNRTYYTLLGYDPNTQKSSIKLLDVLYFTGKYPKFGYPLFDTKEGKVKRVLMEHSNKATISLQFDQKRDKIIFDHLSPMTPRMKEFREYYVPDMSYDAFAWNGKNWELEEDIIAVNKETSKDLQLEAYDSEMDTVISVSVRKKWINPEDSNSPIGDGQHTAVTPEDVKDQKTKKDREESAAPPEPDNKEFEGVSFSNLNEKKKKRKRKKRKNKR